MVEYVPGAGKRRPRNLAVRFVPGGERKYYYVPDKKTQGRQTQAGTTSSSAATATAAAQLDQAVEAARGSAAASADHPSASCPLGASSAGCSPGPQAGGHDDGPVYTHDGLSDAGGDSSGHKEDASFGQGSIPWEYIGDMQRLTAREQLPPRPVAADAGATKCTFAMPGWDSQQCKLQARTIAFPGLQLVSFSDDATSVIGWCTCTAEHRTARAVLQGAAAAAQSLTWKAADVAGVCPQDCLHLSSLKVGSIRFAVMPDTSRWSCTCTHVGQHDVSQHAALVALNAGLGQELQREQRRRGVRAGGLLFLGW